MVETVRKQKPDRVAGAESSGSFSMLALRK
jgi:hypothetical protein